MKSETDAPTVVGGGRLLSTSTWWDGYKAGGGIK